MNKDYDVLLINARSWERVPSYIPNGLCYMSSILRDEGIKVGIHDRNVDRTDIKQVIADKKSRIYGISVLTGKVILDAIDISVAIRQVCPDAIIVWGGLHPTLFPEAVLRENYVDYIVMGEGEYPFFEFTKGILSNTLNRKEIKNLGYKNEGRIVLNEIRPFIDMEKLPFPAWDLLPDMKNYFLLRSYGRRAVNLNTSRGCPHNCSFCYNAGVNNRRWRGMSAEKVVAQIEHLCKEYGIDSVFFHEDNFDANKKRVIRYCNLLLEKKIKIRWEHFSKVNYADGEQLRLEKKAGCALISYGLESGSDRILKIIHKDQTREDVKKAIDLCRKAGIAAAVSTIIGYPMEERQELDETLSLLKEIKVQNVFPQIFNPYPGSELFKYVVERKIFTMPSTLKEQGEAYSVDNVALNMSRIPSGYLSGIIKSYETYNIRNEVFAYLREMNILGLMRAFVRMLPQRILKLKK